MCWRSLPKCAFDLSAVAPGIHAKSTTLSKAMVMARGFLRMEAYELPVRPMRWKSSYETSRPQTTLLYTATASANSQPLWQSHKGEKRMSLRNFWLVHERRMMSGPEARKNAESNSKAHTQAKRSCKHPSHILDGGRGLWTTPATAPKASQGEVTLE